MSTRIIYTTSGQTAEDARREWIKENGYDAVPVIPRGMPDREFVRADEWVEAKTQHKKRPVCWSGIVEGGTAVSCTTAISGVVAIEIDFPRELSEPLLDQLSRLPGLRDKIAQMPIGVSGEGRFILLARGDLAARQKGHDWLSPEGDDVGRVVIHGTDDLVPVSGAYQHQIIDDEKLRGTLIALPVFTKTIDWVGALGPIDVPYDELPEIDAEVDLPVIHDAAARLLELEGWRRLDDLRCRYALDAPVRMSRGDIVGDGIVFETTKRHNGETWLAVYDPETDTINLPKEAGLLPTQEEREQTRQALAESIRPPRPQRKTMAIAKPYVEEEPNQ